MTTNYDWAADVLEQAGLPTSDNNVDNFVRWMAAERQPVVWWTNSDPLNANNLLEGDAESFPNLDLAASATAAILRQGNMAGIWGALAAQVPLSAFSAAVVASPWAASHYGGNPDYIAQIPLPLEIPAPGTPPSPQPPIPPVPVPPAPKPPEEEMFIYAVVNGTGYVINPGFTEKKGISDAKDAAVIASSGQYLVWDGQQGRPSLSAAFVNAIPNG